ncbi:thrombospondin type 3 repeat-containing protein [Sorangium sp. So ce118]
MFGRGKAGLAPLFGLLAALLCWKPAYGAPSAVTFTISHANCGDDGGFALFVGGTHIDTLPSTNACFCNWTPLVATYTDPAVLALLDAPQCNDVRVEAVDGADVAWGFVKVAVESAEGVETACIYDAGTAVPSRRCAERDLCDAFSFLPSVSQADSDGDGISGGIGNGCDNCDGVANAGQEDADADGTGDACDNCLETSTPDQSDSDRNGVGDACDTCWATGSWDTDGDGACGDRDNCAFNHNPGQEDSDADGFGDACDHCSGAGTWDSDGDALCDERDNCAGNPNPGQEDSDADGTGDACDNCPSVVNPDQLDGDYNGTGDACDPCEAAGSWDYDRDGTCDSTDNCAGHPNPGQEDSDADGAGDACDYCSGAGASDYDGDGACDGVDSCLYDHNPGQEDGDADGTGDACDPCVGRENWDYDGDGLCDDADNCYYTYNPGQEDGDADGNGDACDSCEGAGGWDGDGDGVCDDRDNCSWTYNPGQEDSDGDVIGDACDYCSGIGERDTDGDGSCDGVDNCSWTYNPGQEDSDADGVGDACDNCPAAANPDQSDSNNNNVGDACDACWAVGDWDDDRDGTCDEADNCSWSYNPGQEDGDGDGTGDACDNCPAAPNADQSDIDNNGVGDVCDPCLLAGTGNSDWDAVCDPEDNCPYDDNPDQADIDSDGTGDVCDPFCGAIIDNGTVQLGLNCEGHLNAPLDFDADPLGLGVMGLRYLPTGNQGIGTWSWSEGWGVGDAATLISGYANLGFDGYPFTVHRVSFSATPDSAVSTVQIAEAFRVTHDYRPSSATPSLYEVVVTIENISADTVDLLYRRVMDWGIYPDPYQELVTLDRGGVDELFRTDLGSMNSANPFGYTSMLAGPATDAGPGDLGALFDFDFGSLAPGDAHVFRLFYGAAGTRAGALAALDAVGAEAYSLARPAEPAGAEPGAPNTFVFAYARGAAAPACGDGALDPGEACDDGNLTDGDGCTATCVSCADTDADGACDDSDNCPDDRNPVQEDSDGDGTGDACDPVCVTLQRGLAGDVADTSVWAAYPDYNEGDALYVHSGTSQGFTKHALFRFELGSIPLGATVTSATFVTAVVSSGTQPIRAHRVTAPWDEATVTWRSFASGYAPAVEGTATGAPYGTGVMDLTALVQAWVDGAHPNHGVLLEEDGGARTAFRSSEHHAASQRPRLEVCYTPY